MNLHPEFPLSLSINMIHSLLFHVALKYNAPALPRYGEAYIIMHC